MNQSELFSILVDLKKQLYSKPSATIKKIIMDADLYLAYENYLLSLPPYYGEFMSFKGFPVEMGNNPGSGFEFGDRSSAENFAP